MNPDAKITPEEPTVKTLQGLFKKGPKNGEHGEVNVYSINHQCNKRVASFTKCQRAKLIGNIRLR